MGWLSILGSVASIAGLIITIWVLCRVRKIEEAFLKQALLPSRMRVLRGHIRNLEQAIQAKNRQLALQALERCRSLLTASSGYLERDQWESCEQKVQAIERVCQTSDEDEFWTGCGRALAGLHGVHESLKMLAKELEWRSKDAN